MLVAYSSGLPILRYKRQLIMQGAGGTFMKDRDRQKCLKFFYSTS